MLIPDTARHLIGDAAYDSAPLDETLADCGVNMIAFNREDRKK